MTEDEEARHARRVSSLHDRAEAAVSEARRVILWSLALSERMAARRGEPWRDPHELPDEWPVAPPSEGRCPFCGERDCRDHLDLLGS